MRIVISNFSPEVPSRQDFRELWRRAQFPPPPRRRNRLFEQPADWGFHLYSIGVYLMDWGVAERVEFWDYAPERSVSYHPNGVLSVIFHNRDDVGAYLDRFGPPDLFINHGRNGASVLPLLEGKTFRVHVPALRARDDPLPDAECFLIDAEDELVERSMVYIPVVNTEKIRPGTATEERDFIYLASCREAKRHDLLISAVRGTELTGHLHPVGPTQLDLAGTRITTSDFDERSVVELLQTSRIAVYTGDWTSNPAAMWECVAAGLPIVINTAIRGGKHLVVPGITGELAAEDEFLDAMRSVLAKRDKYSPREYFEANWDTVTWIERYLAFFVEMGWNP